MGLSALPIFSVLGVMVVLRRETWKRRIGIAVGAGVIGVIVYFAVNPYVAINYFRNREVLKSNLGTSTAMYHVTGSGSALANAVLLMAEGTSGPLMVAGIAGAAVLAFRRRGVSIGWLVSTPAAAVTVYLCLLAAGKPGEYGRFGLLPDIALGIAAASGAAVLLQNSKWRAALVGVLVLATVVCGGRYLVCFVADRGANTPRMHEAGRLAGVLGKGESMTMGLYAEPAPYCLPPIDLWRWKLMLVPRGYRAGAGDFDVIVRAVDVPVKGDVRGYELLPDGGFSPAAWWPARISWAAKPFEVLVRRGLNPAAEGAGRARSQTPPAR
jgi:hypothetical protein